jgi:hypothetical protein
MPIGITTSAGIHLSAQGTSKISKAWRVAKTAIVAQNHTYPLSFHLIAIVIMMIATE